MADNNFEKPVIVFSQYSPYTVIELHRLTNSKNKELKTEPVFSLCRCGQSKYKPYCDGSHSEKGIKGTKEEDRNPDCVKDYAGKDITIHDNRGVCCHDRTCLELPDVFDRDKKPWINPDGAPVEEIIKIIERCPSGALSYTVGSKKFQGLEREPEIHVSKNGPLHVSGSIILKDDLNNQPECREHYTLCRCGGSKNVPFCDGSHHDNGFDDEK